MLPVPGWTRLWLEPESVPVPVRESRQQAAGGVVGRKARGRRVCRGPVACEGKWLQLLLQGQSQSHSPPSSLAVESKTRGVFPPFNMGGTNLSWV